MAQNIFLQLDGIKGESTDQKHQGWLEPLSFGHSFTQPTKPTSLSSSGSRTVEKATHGDFTFAKYLDGSTDDLIRACWSGKVIKTAKLECYRASGAGDSAALYLEVDFEGVVVSNYQVSGGPGDIPTENISLAYGKVKYIYKAQDEKTGAEGSAQEGVQHDLWLNVVS